MKLSKRLLCTLLAVVFTVVSVAALPAFAEFTDIDSGQSAYDAVNVLNKLGVINGYDDGTFKPDNNVTRAEFTAMLLRTRGMGDLGSTSLENPPFPDVTTSDVSWAIGNIRTAHEMGIINGYDDGTFLPNNNVLYEEAVKMIVCALGYGEMGVDGSEWYSKYLQTATSLGFTSGAGGAIGAPATRAVIAQMLFNCLDVKLAENNEITTKTILENDLGLTKKTGYISSSAEISLSSPNTTLRADEIQITADGETLTYKVNNASAYNDMLGAYIEFYYTTDRSAGTLSLLTASVKNSVTLEIDASLIEGCGASSVSYYKDEDAASATTVAVASDSIVVYNDQLYGSTAVNSTFANYVAENGAAAMPLVGNVKLLDRDGDKVYDVVFINKYDVYVASAVTSSSYTVTDNVLRNGISNNKVVLDYIEDDIKFVDVSGSESSFAAIKKGSVICVKRSNTANGGVLVTTVVVCNNSITGTVGSTNSSGTVTIGSKSYEYSLMAPWKNPISGATTTLTSLSKGDAGTFYLDMDGKIVAYDKTETASNQQYGYIMQVNYDNDDFEESLQLYVVNQSGSKVTYTIDTKSKLNGSVPTGGLTGYRDELKLTAMPNGSANYPSSTNDTYAQLVKFSTTTRGGQTVIDDIITADPESGGQTITTEALYLYDDVSVASSCTYKSTQKQMICGSDKIYVGSAIVISVPENKGNTSKYKVMSLSDLSNNGSYNVEFYDVSASDSAKVLLVYGGSTTAGEVTAISPVLLITEIEESERIVLKGFVNGTEQEYTLSEDDSETLTVANRLQKGDMVRLGKDDDGYATVKAEHVIFSMKDGYRSTAISYGNNAGAYPKSEDDTTGNLRYRVIWGSAYAVDDDTESNPRLRVSTDILSGTETGSIDTFDVQKSWYSGANVYLVKKEGSDITVKRVPVSDLEGIQYFDGDATPTELFVYMTGSSSVGDIIIAER